MPVAEEPIEEAHQALDQIARVGVGAASAAVQASAHSREAKHRQEQTAAQETERRTKTAMAETQTGAAAREHVAGIAGTVQGATVDQVATEALKHLEPVELAAGAQL